MPQKVFLLDAMALIYRAHFVFIKNPRLTSTGLNTSAVFGFTNTVLELLRKERPTHLGVAFDPPGPTLREELLASYKANRPETPEDIRAAIPFVKRLCQALHIPILEVQGYEADDVIGTLSHQMATPELHFYLFTPDKDYAQLVNENVFLMRPGYKGSDVDVMDRQGVKDKFGVWPEQVADWLGLKGDSVDNIPGVPKIGEKTALELLDQFGTLEAAIARADEIAKKSIRETLTQNVDIGRLSKQLATIDTAVKLDVTLRDLQLDYPDLAAVDALFEELEFRTLKQRLADVYRQAPSDLFAAPSLQLATGPENSLRSEGSPDVEVPALPDYQTLENWPHDYTQADTADAQAALCKELLAADRFSFDTETTGLDALQAELVGLSFATEPGRAWYVPCPDDRAETLRILARLAPALESDRLKVGHNLKYDLHILAQYGQTVAGPLYDTMLAHYVVDGSGKHGMDILAERLLHYRPISITELIGPKGKKQLTMRDVPPEMVAEYAAEDADVTLRLMDAMLPKVREMEADRLLNEVELPLVPVLQRMEAEGIRVDVDFLADYSVELGKEMQALQAEVFQLAGQEFNLNSPKQLGEILFDKLGLPSSKKTKTGQYTTDEETLSRLAAEHPMPAKLMGYRELTKLKSTYVDAIPTLLNPKTGRIHTTYNQAVAVTGRLSSQYPNLQNIPIRTALGREVRKAFVPRQAGWVLMSADYSQIELRVVAALSQDEAMLEAFARGADIHRATAARVFGVSEAEVNDDMRRKAKMVNFGLIYGISAFGLAQRLGISRTEAKEIIDAYFAQYSSIKRFMDDTITQSRERGFTQTLMGRRQALPDLQSGNPTVRGFAERNAINTPIQGTAAELMKLAMIRVDDALRASTLEAKLLLQVHDELVLDVPQSEVPQVTELVRVAMREAMDIGVPLDVSLGTGPTWLEAH